MNQDVLNTLSWMFVNESNKTFVKTIKLLKIIVEIPMPSDKSER